MLQRIDLCRFQAKQTFTQATEASSKWNSRMKIVETDIVILLLL